MDPDPGRAGEPGGGGGRGARERGRPVPARRVPGRRAAPDRRRHARVRLPLGHRAQVPARPRGTGFLYVRRDVARAPRAAVPRRARGALGARRRGGRAATTPAASRAGSTRSPIVSASVRRSTTRSRSASTPSPIASSPWPRRCASSSPASPGSRCTTAASSGAGSSPSPSTASTCTNWRPPARRRHINISVSTIDFARYDFEARGSTAVARASVHYYNTEDELTRLVDAVATATRAVTSSRWCSASCAGPRVISAAFNSPRSAC